MSDETKEAGRAYTPPKGPKGKENKNYGGKYTTVPDGKWKPEKKDKCFYETGDEKDRCYVTQNGGPGGQKKPDTGKAKNKAEYNKKYDQQRWNGERKAARLEELRQQRLAGLQVEARQKEAAATDLQASINGLLEQYVDEVARLTLVVIGKQTWQVRPGQNDLSRRVLNYEGDFFELEISSQPPYKIDVRTDLFRPFTMQATNAASNAAGILRRLNLKGISWGD